MTRVRKPPARLESARLVLRRPQVEDAPAVVEAIAESFEELRKWMAWAQHVPGLDEQEARLREGGARFDAGEDFVFFLFERESGLYLGGTGLHRFDWSVPRFEIGYWVRTSRVGRGYATEAVHALSALAFEGLSAVRVEIRCNDRNERSWRVAERAGFALEAVLRSYEREADGTLRDTRIYARVRPEGDSIGRPHTREREGGER